MRVRATRAAPEQITLPGYLVVFSHRHEDTALGRLFVGCGNPQTCTWSEVPWRAPWRRRLRVLPQNLLALRIEHWIDGTTDLGPALVGAVLRGWRRLLRCWFLGLYREPRRQHDAGKSADDFRPELQQAWHSVRRWLRCVGSRGH